METVTPLCILQVISTVSCPFPYPSLYSYTSPTCTLPLPLCGVAIQVNQVSVYTHSNPKCPLSFSVSVVTIQNTQGCVFDYKNSKFVIFRSPLMKRYDVFLNHRGPDVKESVASLIFYNLKNKGFKVFLDKNSVEVGEYIPEAIEEAIYSSNVHLLIFSANYAKSVWCLKELEMIVKTGAPIIPLFYGVEPSELQMKDEKSVYYRAFQEHKHTGNFEPHVLQEWKKALHQVSYIRGHIFTGDQGELLERIASNVADLIDRAKFHLRS